MKNILDIFKKMPLIAVIAIIAVAIATVMFGFVIPAYNNIGLFGETTGNAFGIAVGSYEGVTQGYSEGYNAGKEEGLSADDTVAEVKNDLLSLGSGKLQVLNVSARLGNFHSISDDYAALYMTKCKVTYTVDLNNTQIEQNGNSITITFPEPIAEISNESDPIKIFESQKFSFSGTSKDGAEALVNTMNKVHDVSENELANDEGLRNQAIEAAKKQIADIAEAATLGHPSITVKCVSE